jgi:HEAT repeat protein
VTAPSTAEQALAILEDEERPEHERLEAVAFLRDNGRAEHVDRLFTVLERSEVGLGLPIVEALRAMNAQALVTRHLRFGRPTQRQLAAMRLVRLADAAAAPALLEARKDPIARLRVDVYEALARIPTAPGVLDGLIDGLTDPDPDARSAAVWGLGASGDAVALPHLQQRLDRETDDVSRHFLKQAIRKLRRAAGG